MLRQIIFIQGGGGKADYDLDALLVDSLQDNLGKDYEIRYPLLSDDDSSPDFGRLTQIDKEVSSLNSPIILIGHSLGASMLLKYISEKEIKNDVIGVFLLATPFWEGDEDWKQGLILKENFIESLPKSTPMFFYHSKDDNEIPFSHIYEYQKRIKQASYREIEKGGHQLNNDLSIVAKDIKDLLLFKIMPVANNDYKQLGQK